MICPGCQTLNFRDYKFCRECGHKLELPAPAQPTMMLTAQAAAASDDAQVQQLLDEAFRSLENGALGDAALACQGALALRPESTAAHSLLGLVYERQGNVPDAIQQYRIVLDLNPTSKADRAKLDLLLARTGQKKRSWWEGQRPLHRRTIAGAAATVLIFFTALLVLARSATPPERSHRRLGTPTVRTTPDPAPTMSYPPTAMASPPPAPPPLAPPPSLSGVGGIPRHTLTNDPVPRMTQIAQTPTRFFPRNAMPARPPAFLQPAPIRGVAGLTSGSLPISGLQPARGPVPVLPDSQAPPTAPDTAPTASSNTPPVMPSGAVAPPSSPPTDNGVPGSSINIRRLDGDSNASPGTSQGAGQGANGGANAGANQPPQQPSMADARYHYNVAGELYRRGEVEAAYREFASARELFQRINSRGGAESLLAAQGALASHRAMQEIAAAQR